MPRWLKPLVFIACLLPLAWLIWQGVNDDLGANPIETITHRTGLLTLQLLLLTLTVTPLRNLSGWHALLRLRRMLGLFAFFYACLHFLTYLWLDQFFEVAGIIDDVAERPFITVGFTAFVLLIPLAATSTNAMMRRLGRRWQPLHRLVYGIAILGVVHFVWVVKADTREPLIYALLLTLLLSFRLRRRPAAQRARAAGAGDRCAERLRQR